MPIRREEEEDAPQWFGARGLPWLQAERDARPWLSDLYATPTDDHSMWDAVQGVDLGGEIALGAPPLPPVPPGAGPGGGPAQGRRNRRQNKLTRRVGPLRAGTHREPLGGAKK